MLEAVRSVVASRAGARLDADLGADALLASINKSAGGEADTDPVRHLAAIRQFVTSRMLFALLDFPFSPIFIAILYIIHPILFWLTLAGAVVLFILAVATQRLSKNASVRASQKQSSALTMAQSLARNSDTLQAMGMTKDGVRLWGSQNAGTLVEHGTVDFRSAVMAGLSKTIRMGLQIAILGVGALLVLNHEMTAGMIFAAAIISGRALQPIDQVIGGWKQFITCWASWKSLKATLVSHRPEEGKTLLDDPKGHISVSDVLVMNSAGPSVPPILNRVSFELAPGSVLGVVGPSGSGKSTLARVIVGVQPIQAGSVRIDGTDVQNWDREQLGRSIGYLSQDVELLPGTVKENIARLTDQPDDFAVLEAAKKAQVHSLIQSLPQGYDTRIGPGGLGLSGGQRQRIGLARAFYGNPKIMILDEPNANLDDDGELALHRALVATRTAGVTVVIVTQRKQVLNLVDQILRLHSGMVDYMGTRDRFAALLRERRKDIAEAAAAAKSAREQALNQEVPQQAEVTK